MSNTIKLKSSATPGKVPLTSDLASGEVAINTADGKLYALVGGVVTSLTLRDWSELAGKPATFTPSDHTQSIASVDGLQTIISDLTARIAALESQGNNADGMKLLSTETLTNGTEFIFDSLMDDTVYGSYLLILNNVTISDTDFVGKYMGLSIQQSAGGGFWDGYGAFRMKVLANDGSTTPVAKEYLGLRLMDDTFDSINISGQINITPGGNGLGAITGHLQTGNGIPYLYATMSAEWGGTMHGIKLFASVADKLSGSVSLYGLKK